MRNKDRLPIWRDANRLLLEIEQAVRGVPRYHKYTVGTDLRRQAMDVCRLLVRALSAEGQQRLHQVQQMRLAVDDLKLIHLCPSFCSQQSPVCQQDLSERSSTSSIC